MLVPDCSNYCYWPRNSFEDYFFIHYLTQIAICFDYYTYCIVIIAKFDFVANCYSFLLNFGFHFISDLELECLVFILYLYFFIEKVLINFLLIVGFAIHNLTYSAFGTTIGMVISFDFKFIEKITNFEEVTMAEYFD